MKKISVILIWAIFLTIPLVAAIVTQPASGTAYVGETIRFQTDCNSALSTNWYWGDGSSTLGKIDEILFWVNHLYKNPGSYNVHAHRVTMATPPACGLDTYRTVTILENRSISMSPSQPSLGQAIQFTAVNFKTPANITWDMGDGTTYPKNNNIISHIYSKSGIFTVKAYDWNGDTTTMPVTITVVLARAIVYSPLTPRVDQPVDIQAVGFQSSSIDWNFGDGTPQQTYSAAVSHRYQNQGTFIITACEHATSLTPASKAITILPENRTLALSTPELRADEVLTITALNFRSPLILWDFGDNTVVSGPATMTHTYKLPGNYTISARDENGASEKKIQAQVKVLGISDQVNLEIAEITLDNGKYYKVIPRNSKSIKAQLRMKMRGTGIVTGYWIVDNQPYQFFNETVYQGQIRTIFTQEIPGLPAFDPGMHTITMQLTRPKEETVVFPTLRYFVLPYENLIETLSPKDGTIIKENEIAKFSWEKALGGSYYQIMFANGLLPLLHNSADLKWLDCPERFNFTPDTETWNAIKRNQWTYWQVRAMDSSKNILAASNIQEIKVIIQGAQIGIEKITDMDGNNIAIGSAFTEARTDQLMIYGQLTYPGDAEYLILQVYANDSKVDQLLFRDVRKDEKRAFETSIPNMDKESRIVFQVLKSSSPSVIIGYLELRLKKE